MKKVIKPSKQPTKKRSLRTAETAKLTIAISKIAAQLVKDHPKLIKGGGSLGITELLFSKILIKGGKLDDAARKKIIEFLNDIAPQVNKLKNDLITKLLEYLATLDAIKDYNIYKNIIKINEEFMKGLYDYDIKDDIQDQIGDIKEEIKEYIAILDIVRKFYILSRLKDDETEAAVSTKNKINENKFEPLPSNILEALREKNENLKDTLEEYFKKKVRDNDNGAPEVEEETLLTLRTTLKQLERDVARYISLFFSTNKIIREGREGSFSFETPPASDAKEVQENALKNLNVLYSEFSNKINDKFNEIRSKYDKKDTKYNLVDIEADLKTLLELNETLNQIYTSKKKNIKNYLDIIDPERHTVSSAMEVESSLSSDLKALNVGWGEGPKNPLASPSTGGNPAKYKSTGQVVYIMYKNKKYKRVIYVKDKRNTRYCKINKEYILLSKLKVIQ